MTLHEPPNLGSGPSRRLGTDVGRLPEKRLLNLWNRDQRGGDEPCCLTAVNRLLHDVVLSGLMWATEAVNSDQLGTTTIGSGHPGGQAKSLQMAPYPVGVDFRRWPCTLRATVRCLLRQDVVRHAPSYAPHVKAPPHVGQDVVQYTPCHLRWPIMSMDRGLGHPLTGI